MHIRVVLQARMSSSRLPGKVLLPIAGMPLVMLCAKRITRDGLDLVLATSNEKSDDVLASEASKYNLKVFRGSLGNVLSRFVGAVKDLAADDVMVRVTADNPVVDADFVRSLVENFQKLKVDYLGSSSPLDALPYGLSAEIMTVDALRRADEKAISQYQREHVTPWIRENMRSEIVDGFNLLDQHDLSYLRCTVDTFDDYQCATEIFKAEHINAIDSPWQQLINELQALSSAPVFRVPFRNKRNAIESVVALGTVQLGLDYGIANQSGMPDQQQAVSLVRNAIEHGVSWIDTARGYGLSEQRVGAALSAGWQSRTRVVTKLDPLGGLPEDATVACIESTVHESLLMSLHALNMKKLDVLLLHRWAHRTSHQGKIWEWLLDQKAQGLINELGASIYNPEEAIEALSDKDVTHLQIPFNLFDQRWLDDSFQNALANRPDVRIHVRSVFLQGLLISDAEIWPDWVSAASDRVKQINDLVQLLGRQSKADLCMAFVLAQDWVDAIVIGVETNEQLRDNLRLACEKPLTFEECNMVIKSLSDIPERLINPSQW